MTFGRFGGVSVFALYIQKFFGRALHVVAAIAGGWALLYAGIILVQQALTWLKTGLWPPAPISQWLWESFNIQLATAWTGLNEILNSLTNLHVAVLMVVVAAVCFGIAGYGVAMADDADAHINSREAKK